MNLTATNTMYRRRLGSEKATQSFGKGKVDATASFTLGMKTVGLVNHVFGSQTVTLATTTII